MPPSPLPTLLIPAKRDAERDAVAESFSRLGGSVVRLDRFWEPPAVDPKLVRVYGPDSFVLVLQQKLGFALVSPEDRLILSVPQRFLRRQIDLQKLHEVLAGTFPAFVKPVVPKQFSAKIYATAEELRSECRGLSPVVEVFRVSVVRLRAEARAFLLNGCVLDLQIYEGSASRDELTKFASELATQVSLPKSVVADVGVDEHGEPLLIEFNAAWGAGLNGCHPDRVLPAILAASESDDQT